MPSPDISVRVEHLTKKFDGFIAVDDISFEVHRGEVFGFLGPNGAGKSTTIRMLCGIIPPTSGRGEVGGVPLGEQSHRIKSVIGYMSQRFSLYEDLTVGENLDFYAGVYPIPRAQRGSRIEEALETSGLAAQWEQITGTLAGGFKQRLALACALLHRPEILFLDEPTAGVDPFSRRNFWELIYQLSESGVTIFVTTHYMDEAEHCGRIAFIARGRLIKIGSPESLIKSGSKLLEISCRDWLRAFRILSEHRAQVGELALFGTTIHMVAKHGTAEIVTKVLADGDCGLIDIREVPPSLEDVFVSLLGSESA